jgi:hypothetical protein
MNKKSKKSTLIKNRVYLFVFALLLTSSVLALIGSKFFLQNNSKPNGLMMLIEFEQIDGILQWEKELDSRNMTAIIKVQDNVLREYPEVFKRLSDKGYEIAGGYDEAPFWDMPYEEQYQYLKASKEFIEQLTGKKMRVFGSRYFAYDKNTLIAADKLGIDYILARGTQDIEAVIYAPQEYKTKVISVTSVDLGQPMGRGSLCDYSLWARGSTATEFGQIVTESIAKKPRNLILVSHAYLGGTRLIWWQEYKNILDSDLINWQSFDQWLAGQTPISLPNSDININREVNYVAPQPEKPMDQYQAIPGLENLDPSPSVQDQDSTKCQ